MDKPTLATARRLTALGFALAAATLLPGCDYTASQVEGLLNARLESIWDTAASKAAAESDLEDKIDDALDAQAGLVVYDALLFKVKLNGVSNVDVNLGTKPPVMSVSSLSQWESGGKTYLSLSWSMSWAAGNGASLSMDVSLSNAPDPTLKVSSVSATASGTALVVIDSGGHATATVTTSSIHASLTATATITIAMPFGIPDIKFTFDVSSYVKDAVEDMLKDSVIQTAFAGAF